MAIMEMNQEMLVDKVGEASLLAAKPGEPLDLEQLMKQLKGAGVSASKEEVLAAIPVLFQRGEMLVLKKDKNSNQIAICLSE